MRFQGGEVPHRIYYLRVYMLVLSSLNQHPANTNRGNFHEMVMLINKKESPFDCPDER
nr:hypothetical protein Q903MT_gene5255 [Picea sitchensis]